MALDIRERPPLRLDVDAQTPGGQHFHWSASEPAAKNVPNGLSFSTSIPGGFEGMTCTLPRRPQQAFADLTPLTTLTVRGPGGQVAWQGRLESSPRVSGNQMSVSPGAVGWQAHLADDTSAKMIYVDRDLSSWTTMSRSRRITLIAAGLAPFDAQLDVDPSTGIPSLSFVQEGNGSTIRQRGNYMYDAGTGNYLGSIYYDFVRGTNVSSSFAAFVESGAADTLLSTATGDLCASGASTGTLTCAGGERFGFLDFIFPSASGGTNGNTYDVNFRRLIVWGDHGLTKRGTAPADGLYASDVVAHAVRTWAPLLDLSMGTNGSVTDTSFIIPQLVFRDPTTASDIISTANRYHLRDWAVWESSSPTGRPTFYYYDRGTRGKSWRARVAEAKLEEAGPDIGHLFNGVIVRFSDVDGTTKTVGPTGSGCDTTSTSVMDSDPLNPANQAGIKRWAIIDMGGVSTPAGATEVGRRFIVETAQFNTAGRASLVGHVTDDRGVVYPAWRVRAGDTISFTDASDSSARRIVRSTYDDASKTNSIDLDAPAQALEALLQRLQVSIIGIL